ncbi:MAG: PadR family transcriptional regulator [Candidatus Bathyarchaeota archaeon]|nr:PadR family transcriptional regulator [Candidatus Bathyarchaeota archaeon]
MFRRYAEIREKLLKVIEKFRQKGAISSDKAMSVEDLGLSPEFKDLMEGHLRLLGIFVEVDGKYYLSEERLKEVKEQLSSLPLKRWLRHTASVPKGLLRYYVFKLLKDKPMSGSEITEEIERHTDGQWKPSPGSVYPLLAWLRENDYIKELPKEETRIKRYMLTEKGENFFEKHAKFEERLRKKIVSLVPLFFGGLWIDPHPEKLREIREPTRRFVTALFDLRVALTENLTEQALKEVKKFLNETAEKIEEISERIKRG